MNKRSSTSIIATVVTLLLIMSTQSLAEEGKHTSSFCKGDSCTVNTIDTNNKISGKKTQIFHKDCLINYTSIAKFKRCTIRKGLRPYKRVDKYQPKMEYRSIKKNYIYGLFGAGIQNELGVYESKTSSGSQYEIKQRVGPVYGGGYDRLFSLYDYDFIAGAQLQTNITGVDFTRQFTGLLKLGFGF